MSEQLDFWKPARELRSMPLSDVQARIWNRGGGEDYKKTAKSVMAKKVRESKKSGLYESIKAEGVKEPVTISDMGYGSGIKVINGHHRIAAAMSIDPNMLVPVTHEYAEDAKNRHAPLI